jgi:Raf kinase inhibitor-like YbhB/YbcL family protein
MRKNLASWALVGLVAVCGCSDDESDGNTTNSTSSSSAGSGGSGASGGGGAGTTGGAGGDTGSGGTGTTGGAGGSGGGTGGSVQFSIESPAFGDGEMIPEVHECESGGGDNVSPELTWTPGPAGTMSYAVVMRDLDYMGGFLHWVIWDIPSLGLPQGVEGVFEPDDPDGAKQAAFNGNTIGYYGPCSPQSTNTYQFTLYAIPTATLDGLDENSTKQQAATAIEAAATASVAFAGES